MLLRTIAAVSAALAVVLCFWLDVAAWLIPVLFLGFCVLGLLAAFLVLWAFSAVVDLDKPQEHDSKLYRRVIMAYIDALMVLAGVRMDVAGLEKMPDTRRIMLVCNHQNEADPGILMHYFRKYELSFVAKKEADGMFLVGKLMHNDIFPSRLGIKHKTVRIRNIPL